MTRWILFCPFLDDKSVISHVHAKTEDFSIHELDFVSKDFHALVQSQADFENELTTLRSRSQGIPIEMQMPSSEQTSALFGQVGVQIDVKLKRGFRTCMSTSETGVSRNTYVHISYVKTHLNS